MPLRQRRPERTAAEAKIGGPDRGGFDGRHYEARCFEGRCSDGRNGSDKNRRRGGTGLERSPPEPDAQIRVLRWKQFVQSEFESFAANTKKFVKQTGINVRLDAESWDDIRPKAAIAANVGLAQTSSWAPTTTRSNSLRSSST